MTSKETERRLAGYERMVRAMERITVDELAQLRAWEKQNVTGDGRRGELRDDDAKVIGCGRKANPSGGPALAH